MKGDVAGMADSPATRWRLPSRTSLVLFALGSLLFIWPVIETYFDIREMKNRSRFFQSVRDGLEDAAGEELPDTGFEDGLDGS